MRSLRPRPRRFPAAFLVAAGLCLAWPGSGGASQAFRWKDATGVVHYGDAPPTSPRPGSQVETLPIEADPGATVRLRITRENDEWLAWAENLLSGPVEVRVAFARRDNVAGAPALPARATVPAEGVTLVSRLASVDSRRGGDFELRADAIPGQPGARHRDVEYGYPLQSRDLRVEQAFGGQFSHEDDQNRHAVDFAVPVGTGVVAARDGVVMQVENGFNQAGSDQTRYADRANFVRILHADGSMALYAHLREAGVMVRQGQHVRKGQLVGYSGNTGFSSGPHLHFVVQVNRGMRLVSVPFRMFGPQGILRFSEAR